MKIKKIIIAIFIIAITFSLTGCATEMIERPAEVPSIQIDLIYGTQTDDEELIAQKAEHYKKMFNEKGLKMYGNTIEATMPEKYVKSITSDTFSLRTIYPITENNGNPVSVEIYDFKEADGAVKTYQKIQVFEGDKMKEICLESDPIEDKEFSSTNALDAFQEVLNEIQLVASLSNWSVKYINTVDGIDTIRLVDKYGDDSVILCVNPETGDVHVAKFSEDTMVIFSQTDVSTIERPTETTTKRFDFLYYIVKYLGNAKLD